MKTLINLLSLLMIACCGIGNPYNQWVNYDDYKNKFVVYTKYDEEKEHGFIVGGGFIYFNYVLCDECELDSVCKAEYNKAVDAVRKHHIAQNHNCK